MTTHFRSLTRLLVLPSAVIAAGAQAQVNFAPPGARAVLTVEYSYRSEGRAADKYDSREWRVLRTVSIRAELEATKPALMSAVQVPDAGQQARTDRAVAQGEAIAQQMGGSMAEMQAAFARCGEDQACLQKLAMQMANTAAAKPRSETQRVARETEAAMKPGAPRYQLWKGVAQQGSYRISEDAKITHADPICLEGPGKFCHRSEERRGEGALPEGARGSAAFAQAEIDAGKQLLWLRLPMPMNVLPYTETVVTDEPQHTRGKTNARLQSNKSLDFRALRELGPFSVALQPGAKSQAGEFSVQTKGQRDEAGTLAVRWRFTIP